MKYLLVTTLVFLSACGGVKSLSEGKIFAEPEYSLSAVRFVEIDMERLVLEVDLVVTNPNLIGLEFENVAYQLMLDNTKVLEGQLKDDKLKVPAKGDVEVTIPLNIQMENLANGAISLMLNRKIAYNFEANLNSTIPILNKKTFKVNKSEVLNF